MKGNCVVCNYNTEYISKENVMFSIKNFTEIITNTEGIYGIEIVSKDSSRGETMLFGDVYMVMKSPAAIVRRF